MKGLIAFIGIAIIAGGLFSTKPDRKAFEDYLETEMVSAFGAAQVDANDDPLVTFINATCKFARSECYSVIRAFLEVEYIDMIIASRFDIRLNQDQASCLGILGQIYCADV